MSFIETALNRAKEIGRAASDATPSGRVDGQRNVKSGRTRRKMALDSATLAAREALARPRIPAVIDKAAVEANGVMVGHNADDRALRAYRILRTRVQHRLESQGWSAIGVTSSAPSEGKSLTAINLSIALAKDPGTWVFLVDLDLQRPRVASYLGMGFQAGLSDYIAGNAHFDDILYSVGVDRLTVIPNRHAIDSSSDLLGSPRISEFCSALKAEQPHHVIIYDLPPVLVSDDVLKCSTHMDAALFIVAEGATPRSTLRRASEAMRGINVLGLVLNRSTETQVDLYY